MSEVKVNIEEGKPEEEDVSYTLRGIPGAVHKKIISFQKEITYKRDEKYSLERTYVEALKDWAEARPDSLPKVVAHV
jgi:hypothetical protein